MGSEYERDGRWVVSGKDATGRWREKRTTCRTKAEARRMREDLERQAERQAMGLEPLLQNRGKATFGELIDWWWGRHGKRLKSPTIRVFVEKHLRGQIPGGGRGAPARRRHAPYHLLAVVRQVRGTL